MVVRRCLLLLLLGILLTTYARAADEATPLIGNGGFEDGTKGWMWEQWKNKPLPGVIDNNEPAEGKASFRMGLAGGEGGRWLAKEIAIPKADQAYLITFSLKARDLPENVVRVRVGIDGKGFLGSASGKPDFARTAGTHDWKPFKIGLPAAELGGVKKVTIFFYHDQVGTGSLWIDALTMREATEAEATESARAAGPAAPAAAKVVLTGETSRPANSTFPVGEKVELTFRLTVAADASAPERLQLTILDEHDQQIEAKQIPIIVQDGKWETTVVGPSEKLGFYRVKATLSDGTPLAAVGSRAAGYLTYIVVPDPAKRPVLDEDTARFGMQAAPWSGDGAALIGARWVLDDSTFWRRREPDRPGQWSEQDIQKYISSKGPGTAAFPMFTLSTFFVAPKWAVYPETLSYNTGKLTPEGEKAWAEYCKTAAKAWAARYKDRKKHIYQITWEPIRPWGFKGTDADLVRIYEIAYQAIHEVDPAAVVAGPCRGIFGNGDPAGTARLLEAGLGRYLDAYTAHPYCSLTPERDGMVQNIRRIRKMLHDATGRDLPMYGTEQGLHTDEDPTRELQVAQIAMRQNLITLGEGFQWNMAFFYYDYRLAGQKGYGYYYNLEKGVPFASKPKVAPKPAAAAFAAQSFLIDGSKTVGPIEWLGGETLGYAFERADGVTLALWSYGSEPRQVTIPTGVSQVQLYDWMGNGQTTATPGGSLSLKLGPEPTYVTGVSAKLWGMAGRELLVLDSQELQAYTGQTLTINGKSRMTAGKQALQGKLLVDSETAGIAPVSQPIELGGDDATAFKIDLAIPPTLTPGQHTIRVRLADADGNILAGRAIALDVLAPIAAKIEATQTADAKSAMAVTLVNKQAHAVRGTLSIGLKELLPGAERSNLPMIDLVADPGKSIAVPRTDKQVEFDLPAGGEQRLVIPLPDAELRPARRYEAVTNIAIAEGAAFKQVDPVHFLVAARFAAGPTIDGDLAEWADLPAVQLKAPRDVIRNPKQAPAGLAASVRYGWDDQNLYLAAEVNDDVFLQTNTGMNVWRQDCLQLGFNLDPAAGDGGDARSSEINVALTPQGPQASRSLSYSAEKLPVSDLTPEQFRLAVRKTDDGKLLYEVAIPWASLGAAQAPKAGETIGIALTVNDVRNSQQGDPSSLGLFGGIFPAKDPSKFGTMVLGGQ